MSTKKLDEWGYKGVANPKPNRGKPKYVVTVLRFDRNEKGLFEAQVVDRVPHYTMSTALSSVGAINHPIYDDPDTYHEAFISHAKKGEFDDENPD